MHRLWKPARLQVRRVRRRRKRPERPAVVAAAYPNHVWAYDFLADRDAQGTVLRVFTVMDEFTREGVAIDGGPRPRRSGSLGCWRNWWRFRGRQHTCAATTGRSSWRWRCNSGSRSDRSRRATADPGCPWQNGKDERCNGTVRDEGLNLHRFASVTAAQVRLEVFRQYYNDDRPHSRLGYQTPAEFKRAWAEAQAKGQDSNIPT